MSIEGKVIVITGASSGIGETTAKLLAQKGAKVVLGARRVERLASLTAEIEAAGGTARYQALDVTQFDQVESLVKLALTHFGKVDAIFNNAGIMPNSAMSQVRLAEWNQMIDVNLKGVLNGIAAVLPLFKEQKSGHIITTSSVAGLKNYVGSGVYGATKHAVRNAMEVTRRSLPMKEPISARRPSILLLSILNCWTISGTKQQPNACSPFTKNMVSLQKPSQAVLLCP